MEEKILNKINKLIDQTVFLLEKHKESKQYCTEHFEAFLSLIDEKIKESAEDQERLDKLKSISEIINKQLAEFSKDIEEDMGFLEDQISSIKEISKHSDSEAAAKLIDVLMDGKDIPETEQFKKDLEIEATESKDSFTQVVNDLKDALKEGGIDELLAYLQDIEETNSKDDDIEVSLDIEEEQCCGQNLGCKDCKCGDNCKCETSSTCES